MWMRLLTTISKNMGERQGGRSLYCRYISGRFLCSLISSLKVFLNMGVAAKVVRGIAGSH